MHVLKSGIAFYSRSGSVRPLFKPFAKDHIILPSSNLHRMLFTDIGVGKANFATILFLFRFIIHNTFKKEQE